MTGPTFRIEGSDFHDLDGFYDQIERHLLGGESFGRNLDALNDVLRGDFGPLPATFDLIWADAALSKERLGYVETARQLRLRLQRCHPSNRAAVATELGVAKRGDGPTVFDWLIEIIRDRKNVALRLA